MDYKAALKKAKKVGAAHSEDDALLAQNCSVIQFKAGAVSPELVYDGAKKKGIIKPWPHHVDASAYDIVYVFKKAMEVAKVTGDPSKLKEERTAIRDALGKTRFDLISGNVCFDKNGDAQLPGYILTMKNKKWILLDTHKPLPC